MSQLRVTPPAPDGGISDSGFERSDIRQDADQGHDAGDTASLDAQVTDAANADAGSRDAQGGFRVTLTWDGSGDLNIHLHNGSQTPWFSNDDCFTANRAPLWNPMQNPATGNNPSLDFDNVTSFGPENIVIDEAVIGMTYTIGVHHFERGTGRIATIDILGNGGGGSFQTYRSRPMAGTSRNGNCTDNTFWKVASVTFLSPRDYVITTIDEYSTGRERCAAF